MIAQKHCILFITSSKEKFLEAQITIPELVQLTIDLEEIQENNTKKIIEHKLKQAQAYHHDSLIVEDTSLYFHCLNDALPGPFIKHFMKVLGNDGLYTLCMKYNNFSSIAKTILGYYDASSQKNIFFEGAIKGSIVKPIGTNGFGWDMIFKPIGYSRTFAQMTRGEKTSFSMRTLGFGKLKKYIDKRSYV